MAQGKVHHMTNYTREENLKIQKINVSSSVHVSLNYVYSISAYYIAIFSFIMKDFTQKRS